LCKLGGQQPHYRLIRSLRHRFNVSLFHNLVTWCTGCSDAKAGVDDYYHGLNYTAFLSLVATNLTVVQSIGFGSVAFSFSSLIGTEEMRTASII
jgi:hypothetical protein